MKNKITIISVFLCLIFPLVSHAFAFAPTANLTIIVNTEDQDGPFTFDLTYGQQVNLNTQNLFATTSTSLVAFPGTQYFLTQESVSGLKIASISCISDNPADTFAYQSDSALFSPSGNEHIICTFNDVKAVTPVLIVPGLLGTELTDGNN